MTISSEVNRSGPYEGDGVNTSFVYGFKIYDQGELLVIHTDAAGTETVLTVSTHYTVAGVGDATGTITYPVVGSPLPSGEYITIVRNMTFTQEVDFENQGGYYPEVVETAFDRVVMICQQLEEELDRAVKVDVSDTTTPDALLTAINASVVAAATSEANAATSETNAAASATTATNSITYAAEWANKAEDSLVSAAAGGDEVDDYSALHWANKCIAQAASATASASAASTSASNAATSETNAAASASAASTSATNAATSETNAAASASAASTSASNASTSETNAAASASAASTSASNASTSETNAAASAASAATSYDNFDDRYLGQKAADPALDNDGDPLLTGALYWNTVAEEMRVYNGATWTSLAGAHSHSSFTNLTVTDLTVSESITEDGVVSYGTSGSIALNLANGTYFYPTGAATAGITFSFSNPASSGSLSSFTLELNNAGTYAPTWPAAVDWSGGTQPTWTTGVDIVTFFTRDGGTTWYGFAAGLGMA